jgi:hypothetical protein
MIHAFGRMGELTQPVILSKNTVVAADLELKHGLR